MKKIFDERQKSDMGDGYGHYELTSPTTLKQALAHIKNQNQIWGVLTIKFRGEILRKFDFNTYNGSYFYHNIPSHYLNTEVLSIAFSYCFMNEDITITLKP